GNDTVSYVSLASGVIIDLPSQSTWDGHVNDIVTNIPNAIGSPFDDRFYNTSAPNRFDGGGGNDTVSYVSSASGVIIDLPSQSTWDGHVNDILTNIQNAIGSPFDDRFYSTLAANRFD